MKKTPLTYALSFIIISLLTVVYFELAIAETGSPVSCSTFSRVYYYSQGYYTYGNYSYTSNSRSYSIKKLILKCHKDGGVDKDCLQNITCSDEDSIKKIFECTTKSNDYSFSLISRSKKYALAEVINICTSGFNSRYTNSEECTQQTQCQVANYESTRYID